MNVSLVALAPSEKELSSDMPSPVNLKYGFVNPCAVAVRVILLEGFGVLPAALYTIE